MSQLIQPSFRPSEIGAYISTASYPHRCTLCKRYFHRGEPLRQLPCCKTLAHAGCIIFYYSYSPTNSCFDCHSELNFSGLGIYGGNFRGDTIKEMFNEVRFNGTDLTREEDLEIISDDREEEGVPSVDSSDGGMQIEEEEEEESVIGGGRSGMLQEAQEVQEMQEVQEEQDAQEVQKVQKEQHVSEEEESCTICFVDYEVGSKLKQLTCGHEFHSECIDKWIQRINTCPVCRRAAVVFTRDGQSTANAKELTPSECKLLPTRLYGCDPNAVGIDSDPADGGPSSNYHCTLCRREYTGNTWITPLRCGHHFHGHCIVKRLKGN